MGYELKQQLKLTQKLLLTPQLQLSIKLLQLSKQELQDVVKEECAKNPLLEDVSATEGETPPESAEESVKEGAAAEMEWQDYLETYDERGLFKRLDFNENTDEDFFERAPSPGVGLKDHLTLQLNHSHFGERERKIAEFIIGNIDEHGYLSVVEKLDMDDASYEAATLKELSRLMGVEEAEASGVLSKIQEFDPPGVGAVTTRECLLLQAKSLDERDPVVEELIERHFSEFTKKNFKAIAKEMNLPVERITEAVKVIAEFLNPTPGAGFGSEEARVVTPDVIIEKVDGEYVVSLNEDGLPKLKISPYYKKMLRGELVPADAKGYIQERLKSALWLIRSVHQRQRTLRRVAESIVKFQREFFDKGLQHLRPIVLKDVAVDIGMHESTVSRVTTNKYADTPRGIFELKYFFSTGLAAVDGSGVTVEYIKEKLKVLVNGEDARCPFSDQQITEKLKEFGLVLARRTVAKYREELGILSSSRRRASY